MKISNTFKNILSVSTMVALAMSCTDLETEEVDSIVIESAGGEFTAGDPAALLEAMYTSDIGAFTDQNNMYALYTHTSDEMIPPTRGVDWGDNGVWRTLHAHTWDATHSTVLNTWNTLNQRVFKATQIIASNPSPQQLAEAKFLRAFHMWNVMDLYGVVPFREVDEGVDVDPTVLSRSEALTFILADLESSLANLPSIPPSANDINTQGDNIYASKAAAHALLSRIYLNKGVYEAANPAGPYTFSAADMNKVIEHADAVTSEGYSLDPNYFNIYTSTSASEVIWAAGAGTGQNRWFMTLHYSQNPSGWNGFTTLAEFYDKFDTNDPRIGNGTPGTTGYTFDAADFGPTYSGIGKGFLIGQQYNDDGSKTIDGRTTLPLSFTRDVPLSGAPTGSGIRAIKYHPADAGRYIMLRYGEVLLNKAEAILRGGTSSQTAVDVVNLVRSTRGGTDLSSIDLDGMLDERGREMYWEGTRRLDLIRYEKFAETWHEKTSTDPTRVLFPIPSQALSSNPNLVQNEGY